MMKTAVYFNLLVISFVIMALEMTATRLIAPVFGSTVYTWGIIISVFLIGSAAGYLAGGMLADREGYERRFSLLYLTALLSVAVIPFVRDAAFPLLEPLSSVSGTLAGVLLLYLIPNLLFSMLLPFLMKQGMEGEASGVNIGNLHTASSVGSVAGTLVATFLLIPSFSIGIILALLLFLLSVAFITWCLPRPPFRFGLTLLLLLITLLPLFSVEQDELGLLHHENSLYHDIYVYERNGLRWLTFGNKTTVQGAMDVGHPERLVLTYTKDAWEAVTLVKPEPRKAFVLGLGIGSIPARLEREGVQVTTAEIDKAVYEVSRDYFHYAGRGVVIGDGREVLRKSQEKYDLLFLDAYHNTRQIPFHLTTKEFFTLTRNKLTKDGLLLVNSIGKIKGDGFLPSLATTVRSVYRHVYVLGDPENSGRQNILVIGSGVPLEGLERHRLQEVDLTDGVVIRDEDTKLRQLQ